MEKRLIISNIVIGTESLKLARLSLLELKFDDKFEVWKLKSLIKS